MPIHFPIPIHDLSKAEFDERDSVVMRCAYASQNRLGRLCDERVYENDLALRLKAMGMRHVHTQAPLTVSYASFEKIYRLDLIADHALYELKTVASFTGEHDTQVMHYSMMTGVGHGKLLNFRTPKVQGRLRFNALSSNQRRQLEWEDSDWFPLSEECQKLRQRAQDIIYDWGGFLDLQLYNEALLHLFGGEARCVQRVPIICDGTQLGTQRIQSHFKSIFFLLTAFTSDVHQHQHHISRLLKLTGFKGVQWINLNHARIQFITVR